MRTRKVACRRPLGLAWSLASLFAGACAADVRQEAPPSFVELQFDPTVQLSPQPSSLVMNANTGRIDLGLAGIEVPAPDAGEACAEQTRLAVAQCEFDQYLEQLDGFPTLVGATTPTSAAIDLASATLGDNVFVYDLDQAASVVDVDVGYDAQAKQLRIDPRAGWELGRSYLVGIRGYRHGLRSTHGAEAVSSEIYALLKSPRSLSCGASQSARIDASCEYYTLFASDPRFSHLTPSARHAAIAQNLLQLEQLRQYYRGEAAATAIDMWSTLSRAADMAKADVAIGWYFPIHSASVVELNPKLNLVPQISAPNELRLAVKGTLDARNLSAFSLANSSGTVFLFDVDVLRQNPLDPRALPPFVPSYADGQIRLTTSDPNNGLIAGDTYAVLLTDELTDEQGNPLVASPLTVLLRTRGALVDADGKSQVEGFSDGDAAQLEPARQEFASLLDDPQLKAATVSASRPAGLVREHLTYLFGFPFVKP